MPDMQSWSQVKVCGPRQAANICENEDSIKYFNVYKYSVIVDRCVTKLTLDQ